MADQQLCARCGGEPGQVVLVLSSESGFKRWVCANRTGCATRRSRNKALREAEKAAEMRGYDKAIADLRAMAAEHIALFPDAPSFDLYDLAADALEERRGRTEEAPDVA